jgi:hypothetical protein
MKLSVIIPATNPLTSSFQVFFSCVRSWAQLADELIVVDGGTDDDTYGVLREYAPEAIRVADPATQWPVGRGFHGLQITVNLNRALLAATGDWIIVAFADYVAAVDDRDRLKFALAKHDDQAVVCFQRSKIDIPNGIRRDDWRGMAINRRLLNRSDGTPAYRFGASTRTATASDWPVRCEKWSAYLHPHSGAAVDIYYGPEMADGLARVDADALRCCVFDHFFYTPKQVQSQALQFFEYYASRYLGVAAMTASEVDRVKNLDTIAGFATLAEVQGCAELPGVFRDDVARWWQPQAFGAARRAPRRPVTAARQTAARMSRKVRTRLLRQFGYEGLQDQHSWVSLDQALPPALPVRDLWMQQDRLLAGVPSLVRNMLTGPAFQSSTE